jgi:dTMP kinase
MTGWFITFEGVEGAGKSTQIRLLAAWLLAGGYPVMTTREPGGTPLGLRIRDLVLHADAAVCARAELLLYAADRAQHLAEVVEPALTNGTIVLCDRHADSLVAYQTYARGLDPGTVDAANLVATAGRVPHLTFVLDIDPALGLGRIGTRGRPDRLEREDIDFHRRVRAGYLAIARAAPGRVRIIAADRPVEAISADVIAEVGALLGDFSQG